MYFSIPLLGIALIFSKPAIFALNPVYQEASLIVIILAFKSFFLGLSEMFRQALMGIETVDIEKEPKFSKLLKSKLFFTSTIWSVKSIIYLTILIPVLLIINSTETTELELVTAWAVVLLAIELPFFGYFWALIKRNISFSLPYVNVAKYGGATLAFIFVYYITSDFIIIYKQSIFDFLPGLILQSIICIGVYFAITYAIDKRTQKLFKSVIQELINKK